MTCKTLLGAALALCWLGGMASAGPFPPSLYAFGFSGFDTQPAPTLILNHTIFLQTPGYPNSPNTGWWSLTLHHNSPNYIVGRVADLLFNDYFVFDLTNVLDPISSATLLIYNPGPADNPGHQRGFAGAWNATVSIFDVTTPISDLVTPGPFTPSAFYDLGSGTLYGEQRVSRAADGRYVPFELNADAITALNNRSGPLFAFGGSITSSRPAPEPATLLLFGAALAGAFALRRRPSNAASKLCVRLLLAIAT